jgi:hypothetical protein
MGGRTHHPPGQRVEVSGNCAPRLEVPCDTGATMPTVPSVSRKRKRNEKKQRRNREEEGKSSIFFFKA